MATRELTTAERLADFAERWKHYKGTEMSGAGEFMSHLLRCYGVTEHAPGTIFEQKPGALGPENGSLFLDTPKKPGKSLGIARQRMDMYIPKVVVWEMKGPREELARHHDQLLGYWSRTRPRYMVLCNFHEFWIYDTDDENGQLNPKYKLKLEELPASDGALAFLRGEEAHFAQRGARVTSAAAVSVGRVLNQMLEDSGDRAANRERFTKFVLECIFAKFAEDTLILTTRPFTAAMKQAQASGDPAPVFNLFDDFARAEEAERSQSVPYINGPLYDRDHPKFPLAGALIASLYVAIHGEQGKPIDWQDVRPEIFGSIFERSLAGDERAAAGAHFTSEADIMKVVGPTVVRPWRERIAATRTHTDCAALIERMRQYHILDPACGSGNFLYVAYREMKRLEATLRERWTRLYKQNVKRKALDPVPPPPAGPYFSIQQLHGIDKLTEAVQLTQVVLWIGEQLADRELQLGEGNLPLKPLLENIVEGDALFMDWREVVGTGPRACADDENAQAGALAPTIELAIIGNPPFMGRHRMRAALGDDYINKLHKAFPNNRNADLVTYWYPKALEALRSGERAGFVSTNSIAQNESREASIDKILAAGSTLHDCWKSYVWPGEAAVHVSIVSWVTGKYDGQINLDGLPVEQITSALAADVELSGAKLLHANLGLCFEGIKPGNEGFVIDDETRKKIVDADSENAAVIKPLLIGMDIARRTDQSPSRFVIDFGQMSRDDAAKYKAAFRHIQEIVYPTKTSEMDRKPGRAKELWWQHERPRPDMRAAIGGMTHYLSTPRVCPYVLFARIPATVMPDSSLKVLALDSWYHFGILQSAVHEAWAWARGSTLEARLRYTNTTIFETFPFPVGTGPRACAHDEEACENAQAGALAPTKEVVGTGPRACAPADRQAQGPAATGLAPTTASTEWKGIAPAQVEDFHIYRRKLPHWRQTGSMYFVTWRLAQGSRPLDDAERELVAGALRHFDGERYFLYAYVVMDDHVHVLVQPQTGHSLESVYHGWKSITAHKLQREHGRRGKVWQTESFDRIVRDEEELHEKAYYILTNPQRRWGADTEYRWIYINQKFPDFADAREDAQAGALAPTKDAGTGEVGTGPRACADDDNAHENAQARGLAPTATYNPWIVPDTTEAGEVARIAEELYIKRQEACVSMSLGLTKLYNYIKGKTALASLSTEHQQIITDLQGLHEQLNAAVCACYGWGADTWRDENEVLGKLLELNRELAG